MALVNNLIHPKTFIQNSMWFKKDTIDIDTTANNLFIVFLLGQLSQVEALIKDKND